ncbi:recombinase family protein [Roseospira navarrensis]|uniref:Recombinase family protein n=1 Tax=Roseospira navarrensis TaxID=140058 RepID=A0A7X2D5E7_9PROT|nr:recombinase family protein [Roseospira navarrensis]MQX37612.1 recombinase family protein [Roseospira navarrensis]
MTTAAIYARYSSDLQREASIDDQVRICKERLTREGWRLHQVYSDREISGSNLLRAGVQALMADAGRRHFSVVVAESLDRLSRDQEDIAALYKRLSFAGVKIVTLSEGEINELHIGLKGTMGALYLKDLADKTRRGLRGRVEAGKSGGGLTYGYDVVKTLDANGEPIRGERTINEDQARIVRRIFEEYAIGRSSRTIAVDLNKDGVPGPSGKEWGHSTINGNRERGTGILNNELYIGRLVWNRLRYVKDPSTGKRVSRLNPEDEWIIQDVPEMRIVDQDLWDRVKARQKKTGVDTRGKAAPTDGFWNRHRPKTLFSGLLKCGVCGGGFVKISTEHFGCATARNKGTCSNLRTIRRDRMEETILAGLRDHLMDPALYEVFAEEFTKHANRLRMEHNATLAGYKAELERIDRRIKKLIDAVADGMPGSVVKDEMIALADRKEDLKHRLATTDEAPTLLHPNMAKLYRERIAALADALNQPDQQTEAADIIRTLVDRIDLRPDEADPKGLVIDLHGALAGILSLCAESKKAPAVSSEGLQQIKVVAGRGFEPLTFRL